MAIESLRNDIKLIGNEGFRIRAGNAEIYIDAFYHPIPGMAGAPVLRGDGRCEGGPDPRNACAPGPLQARRGDGSRVSHRRDRRGTPRRDQVAGGESPCRTRCGKWSRPRRPPASRRERRSSSCRSPAVTAFRTFHGRGHNSYLIEAAGLRFFHDGDNGDTTRIPVSALGRLDALLIGPWQGSGWVEFVEKLSPPRYFLMHLSEEELEEHAAGTVPARHLRACSEGAGGAAAGAEFLVCGNESGIPTKGAPVMKEPKPCAVRQRKKKFVDIFRTTPAKTVCPNFFVLAHANGCTFQPQCTYCFLKSSFWYLTEPQAFSNTDRMRKEITKLDSTRRTGIVRAEHGQPVGQPGLREEPPADRRPGGSLPRRGRGQGTEACAAAGHERRHARLQAAPGDASRAGT